jgi:hypothetical protein
MPCSFSFAYLGSRAPPPVRRATACERETAICIRTWTDRCPDRRGGHPWCHHVGTSACGLSRPRRHARGAREPLVVLCVCVCVCLEGTFPGEGRTTAETGRLWDLSKASHGGGDIPAERTVERCHVRGGGERPCPSAVSCGGSLCSCLSWMAAQSSHILACTIVVGYVCVKML